MGEVYRDGGYLYVQVAPVENLDPKSKIVNVTFNVYEGEIAFLHRLEFRGNNYTKDKVIRREMMLREGDRFSLAYFKNSILRIKQLGLVDLEKEPDIKPNPDDPTKIDVQVNVKELQRNNIQFTAGYSGYEGTFVALSYSTVNFLGAGETLEFMHPAGQAGQELLLRLLRAVPLRPAHHRGLQHLRPRLHYPWFWQKSAGHRPDPGRPALGDVAGQPHLQLQNVKMTVSDSEEYNLPTILLPVLQQREVQHELDRADALPVDDRQPPDPDPRDDVLGVPQVRRLLPRRRDLPAQAEARVHPLPAVHRPNHVIGVHAQYQFIKALKGSQIPFWEKFYLGGERSIRGYEIYTIGPVDANGYTSAARSPSSSTRSTSSPSAARSTRSFSTTWGNAIAYETSSGLGEHVLLDGPRGPALRPRPEGSVPSDLRVQQQEDLLDRPELRVPFRRRHDFLGRFLA